MADYLQAYADRFALPVKSGFRVERLSKQGNRFILASGDRRIETANVVVAMGSYQRVIVSKFATQLDPGILKLHSADYRNPDQLGKGGVLAVGAGNSGAEIALEVAGKHPTWLSGRDVGHVPVRIERLAARPLVHLLLRVIFHRLLTVNTPLGRMVRSKVLSCGEPIIRVKPRDIFMAGIERVPRVVGISNGLPLLADQRVLKVANVIWCTGFRPDFTWIDLPGFEAHDPWHYGGVIPGCTSLLCCFSTQCHPR
jgi:putative flavoprotein involved in K+ transport